MAASWWHTAWVWYGSGLALALAAALLLLWSLLWDRPRARRRCPRCWYDMSAAKVDAPTDPWTCPECGRTGVGPRPLRRTRRRRAWAALAILALAGAWLLSERPIIQRRGWLWLAPTWPLVQALPFAGTDGEIAEELRRRLGRSAWPSREYLATMTDSQIASLFETCADGTWFAAPTDDRWRASFGPFAREVMLQVYYQRVHARSGRNSPPLTGDHLWRAQAAAERLAKLHGPLTVRTRTRWPRAMPIGLEVPVETWWNDTMRNWTHIRWSVEGTDHKGDQWCTDHCDVKIPDEGHVVLHIDLEWVEGKTAPWKQEDRRVVATASHTLVYDTVESIDDVLQPVSSPAIDAALAAGIVLDKDFTPEWGALRAAKANLDPAMSIGMRIEYIIDGSVIGTSHSRFMGGGSTSGTFGHFDVPSAKNWDEAIALLKNPALKLRIVTDPEWTLYNFDATKYWKGEADVPISQPTNKRP